MSALTVVESPHGDWVGIYVAGSLKYEGHSIPTFKWIDIINECGDVSFAESVECCGEWLESEGSLPYRLTDVVIEG